MTSNCSTRKGRVARIRLVHLLAVLAGLVVLGLISRKGWASGIPVLPAGYTAPPETSTVDDSGANSSTDPNAADVIPDSKSNLQATDAIPDSKPIVANFVPNPQLAPEPATWITGLLGLSLAGWLAFRPRRKAQVHLAA